MTELTLSGLFNEIVRSQPATGSLPRANAVEIFRSWQDAFTQSVQKWREDLPTAGDDPAEAEVIQTRLRQLDAAVALVFTPLTLALNATSTGQTGPPEHRYADSYWPSPPPGGDSKLKWAKDMFLSHGQAPRQSQSLPDPPRPEIEVAVSVLLKALGVSCERVDALLRAAEPPPPREVMRPWTHDGELVSFLQGMFADQIAGNRDRLLDRVDWFRENVAANHGIDVLQYQEGVEQHFRSTGERSAAGHPVTTRPALVREGRTIAFGEVSWRPADARPGGTDPGEPPPATRAEDVPQEELA